ncbi:MAG: hypothetical protein AABZ44_01055 [Elusimicrobiota bacterium]
MATLTEKRHPKENDVLFVRKALGFEEWEMMAALGGISSKTLTNWLRDPRTALEDENLRFLKELIECAKGVIRRDKLSDWIHEPQEEFGGLTSAQMLTSHETRGRVVALLRQLRHGNLA